MKEKLLYGIWLCAYVLCVGLGTISQPGAVGSVILTLIAIAFFIPGGILLADALRAGNKKALLRIRLISGLSLALTLGFIVLTILTVGAGEAVQQGINDLRNLFSAPMFCCRWHWISPFLWACLFISSFPRMWKK